MVIEVGLVCFFFFSSVSHQIGRRLIYIFFLFFSFFVFFFSPLFYYIAGFLFSLSMMSDPQRGFFLTPFGAGRGRGFMHPSSLQFDSLVQGGGVGRPLCSTDVPSPSQGACPSFPDGHSRCSTAPAPDVIAASIVDQMGDALIQQVSQRVAQDILSHLSPSVVAPSPANANALASTPLQSTAARPSHVGASAMNAIDVSQLQCVPQRKLKEPPCFRGDSSDSVSIQEWEDIMRSFIKRGNLQPAEQAEEILIHLGGKAKDVVRFGTRNSGIDVTCNPDAIYGLLRKHFDSVPCSPLPLADFYTTLPGKGEDAFDYWLRLNRAVDLAVERLKDQGKSLDSPSTEVTRMFIKNCPSTELAMTFRSKTIDNWTAHEVQDILNEYHSEMASLMSRVSKEKVSINALAAVPSPALPADVQSAPQPQANDPDALNRLINMLEKVLLQRSLPASVSPASGPTRRSGPRLPRIRGLHDVPCSICQDTAHSAFTHCRDQKLCFKCYSPDHSRRDCPASYQQSEN